MLAGIGDHMLEYLTVLTQHGSEIDSEISLKAYTLDSGVQLGRIEYCIRAQG